MIVPIAVLLFFLGACAVGLAGRGQRASAPLSSGVYLVSLDGRLLDLTRGSSVSFENVDSSAGFVFSPDGRSVAFLCDGSPGDFTTVCAVGLDGRRLVELTPPFAGAIFPFYQLRFAWSPDSRELAASWASTMSTPPEAKTPSVTGELYLAGLRFRARRIARGAILDGDGTGPVWSPDGRLIAFTLLSVPGRLAAGRRGAQDGEVRVVTPTGARAWQTPGWGPAWSPGGELAVVLRLQQTVRIYDEQGRLVRSRKVAGAQSVEWLSSSLLRVENASSTRSTVIDAATGQVSSITTRAPARVGQAARRCGRASICLDAGAPASTSSLGPVISPDGSLRATITPTGAVQVASVKGSHAHTLVQLTGCRAGDGNGVILPPTDLRFTPDGQSLILLAGDC